MRSTPRAKIEAMLADLGFIVIRDLWVQSGGYRSWDLARWGGWAWKGAMYGPEVSIHCWSTMTECARTGITIQESDIGPNEYEVFPHSVQ